MSKGSVQVAKKFYPKFYDGHEVKKFIVPIKPEYHEKLFSDDKRQSTLYEHEKGFIVEGNAIKKAYLSHSRITKISSGDLLIFYRSIDSEITVIGVVEKVLANLKDADDIMKNVGKRTVYRPEEIDEILRKGNVIVLLFIFSNYIPHPQNLDKLKALNVLRGAPQSIQQITQDAYLRLKKAGGIDESFTIN